MSKLEWDKAGEKYYEAGVDQGVLFVALKEPTASTEGYKNYYENGVAWNGLTNVTESPEGGEMNDIYADNIKYASLQSAESFKFSIEAYQYPDEFYACDGSGVNADKLPGLAVGQQGRASFGFSYRTKIGNDLNDNLGYKYHIIYGCKASPSEKTYDTINDSPDAGTMSWDCDSTAFGAFEVTINGEKISFKPTSTLTFAYYGETNGGKGMSKAQKETLESILYGSEVAVSTLPEPAQLVSLVYKTA